MCDCGNANEAGKNKPKTKLCKSKKECPIPSKIEFTMGDTVEDCVDLV